MSGAGVSLRSYEVTMPARWPEYQRVVNARTAGAARSQALRDLRELGCEDIGYPDLRVKSLGAPRTSDRLARVAQYRNRPELGRAGVRVRVGDQLGVVVDADDGANFIVAVDGGGRGHYHPSDVALLVPEVTRG